MPGQVMQELVDDEEVNTEWNTVLSSFHLSTGITSEALRSCYVKTQLMNAVNTVSDYIIEGKSHTMNVVCSVGD